MKLKIVLIFLMLGAGIIQTTCSKRTIVGLDNWYNNEKNPKNNQSFHYLWSDTAHSGYSRWGKIFQNKGAEITTVGKPTQESLEGIDIYIIVDPDSTSETSEPNFCLDEDIRSIEDWVRKGGVLALLGNDSVNCEFKYFNRLSARFGMRFNNTSLHQVYKKDYEMGASKNLPDHPLFRGVSKIYLKQVSDISLTGTAKPILVENGSVIIAENRVGKGYVFAIGDPWIYNEYIDHDFLPASFQNREAAENLTEILMNYSKE